MAPDNDSISGLFGPPRHSLHSKWNVLFDNDDKEWIQVKPALGLHVYPCYSCRHLFYLKKSFQDHINRRAVKLLYKCAACKNDVLVFYNRCALLLHCRKHYALEQGIINLSNLEFAVLDMSLAGFAKVPNFPYFFDVEEEYISDDCFINAQFYSPKPEDKGKEVITLVPSHLVINCTEANGGSQSLTLKQIAKNIPKCQFINLQCLKDLRVQIQMSDEESETHVDVKIEPEEIVQEENPDSEEQSPESIKSQKSHHCCTSNSVNSTPNATNDSPISFDNIIMPVITKIETVEESLSPQSVETISSPEFLQSKRCTECKADVNEALRDHFLGANRPTDLNLKCNDCKLISPTKCSFKAHKRIHEKRPPYVCPDCGEEFQKSEDLIVHIDKICFHSAKSARIKCPGRRCGKIFASEATFGPHFSQAHLVKLYQCWICKDLFRLLEDCEIHALEHKEGVNIVKLYNCPTCDIEDMVESEKEKHLEWHCKDLNRCMYIFMCKFCKCYFRSVATMSTHFKNCRVQKTGKSRTPTGFRPFMTSKYVSGECSKCKNRIIFLKLKPTSLCNRCVRPLEVKKPNVVDKCICILCKKQISFENRRQHQGECKYGKPQVFVEPLDLENINESVVNLNQSSSSSNSDLDALNDGNVKHRRDSSDDRGLKKRHRPSRPKKSEMENDLTADEPIPFDGTYECRFCSYKDTQRENFHEHIKTHRDISTAYQCMECGECFVVKPSLTKHLLHYHNICDFEGYFQSNDCFDQSAVNQLAKVVKAPYLANNVKENQCKVCLEQFDNREDHDQHFRKHGMAFLMRNSM